jgi:hypothetical protein
VLPESADPYKFKSGPLLQGIPISYEGIVKFFLNLDRKVYRVELIYVKNEHFPSP